MGDSRNSSSGKSGIPDSGKDHKHWLARITNPGVPWPVALACNLAAALALILLARNPGGNLWLAVAILIVACIGLYGTALLRWWVRREP
jgi:hypothetical protein